MSAVRIGSVARCGPTKGMASSAMQVNGKERRGCWENLSEWPASQSLKESGLKVGKTKKKRVFTKRKMVQNVDVFGIHLVDSASVKRPWLGS